MENNEENLGSQEPTTQETTTTKPVKSTNTKLIGIIAVAIVVILVVFFMFFTRSAKSTVKDYIKALSKCDADKVMALMDYEGTAAFKSISSYSYAKGNTYKFNEFEDEYDKLMDNVKDLDKDKKKEYEELKKEQVDDLQETLDEFKDKKIKYSVSNIKTEKVDDCKKLTKVTCTLKMKYEDETAEQDITFYTMKKGLKNYIVYAEI